MASDYTRYLAVDPGSQKLGFAIIDHSKTTTDNFRVPDHGMLRPRKVAKEETFTAKSFVAIYDLIDRLCKEWKPNECLVENFGVHGNQRRTGMFVVPRVKAIIELAWYRNMGTIPKTVMVSHWKSGLLGKSAAEKAEVTAKLSHMGLGKGVTNQDEFDAMGIGIGYLLFKSDLRKGAKIIRVRKTA